SHYPEESPSHKVTVDGFWMDKYPVTNEEFKTFVDETNYVTVAERPINPEDYPEIPPEFLVSGSLVFTSPPKQVDMGDISNCWSYVKGASWKHPEGAGSDLEGRWDHPVV